MNVLYFHNILSKYVCTLVVYHPDLAEFEEGVDLQDGVDQGCGIPTGELEEVEVGLQEGVAFRCVEGLGGVDQSAEILLGTDGRHLIEQR